MAHAADVLRARALDLAMHLHRGQTRNDGITPYVAHPIRVAFLLQEAGARAEVVCAGLLHDAIEDTSASWDTLKDVVGVEVADLVVALTEDKREPRAKRKAQLVEHVRAAPPEVKMIKLADRLDNVREAHAAGWGDVKLRGYLAESRALLDAAGPVHDGLCHALADALDALDARLPP